ncbi:hypothetical protein NTE_00757 [Candidatus Nitrososphaera evergladensis SR1]|jgi:uncharacterized protein HemX|uniref:Uncharacterized protein n=1 Tax=Candidatus Nitrososphaera evergladensis SR1 TaxID=1459636 RepID=A0A075MNW6_9ARCH|nr:hypothetical protein [Candidatus Nitrososphaera evergladensis]AIF82835.1 hypothetical protein NTE_00757 [Candidatus Nitrososphaera evergladensis SR1]
MGVLTWILVGVVVLAVLGLGVRTFLSGLQQGVEKIANAPIIKDAAAKAKQLVSEGKDELENSFKEDYHQEENAITNNS